MALRAACAALSYWRERTTAAMPKAMPQQPSRYRSGSRFAALADDCEDDDGDCDAPTAAPAAARETTTRRKMSGGTSSSGVPAAERRRRQSRQCHWQHRR